MDSNELFELGRDLSDLESRYHEEAAALRARVKKLEGTLEGVGSALDSIIELLRSYQSHGLNSPPWVVEQGVLLLRQIDASDDDVRLPGTDLSLHRFYNLFDWCLSRLRAALPEPDDG